MKITITKCESFLEIDFEQYVGQEGELDLQTVQVDLAEARTLYEKLGKVLEAVVSKANKEKKQEGEG